MKNNDCEILIIFQDNEQLIYMEKASNIDELFVELKKWNDAWEFYTTPFDIVFIADPTIDFFEGQYKKFIEEYPQYKFEDGDRSDGRVLGYIFCDQARFCYYVTIISFLNKNASCSKTFATYFEKVLKKPFDEKNLNILNFIQNAKKNPKPTNREIRIIGNYFRLVLKAYDFLVLGVMKKELTLDNYRHQKLIITNEIDKKRKLDESNENKIEAKRKRISISNLLNPMN